MKLVAVDKKMLASNAPIADVVRVDFIGHIWRHFKLTARWWYYR